MSDKSGSNANVNHIYVCKLTNKTLCGGCIVMLGGGDQECWVQLELIIGGSNQSQR